MMGRYRETQRPYISFGPVYQGLTETHRVEHGYYEKLEIQGGENNCKPSSAHHRSIRDLERDFSGRPVGDA